MPRYKYYDYKQTAMLAVDLEKQILPGTLEYAIHRLVEERVRIEVFENKQKNEETGRPAYDPKVMLKIVLLGYSKGLISSRKIEAACRENILFMAISCVQKPDNSTISGFVSTMEEEIKPLYRDILLVCNELKLLGGTSFALDGLKLPSNASKHLSGTQEELRNNKKKLEKKIGKLIKEHQRLDKKGDKKEGVRSKEAHQLERLRRKAEKIDRWLKSNEPKMGKQGKEVKSNITDNDSCKMSTTSGVIQGYNGQALVDEKHQIIIYSEAFGSGQDYSHVTPMIEGAKENIKAIGRGENYFEGKTFTADANYHSTENIKKCEEEKMDAYIPDVDFRSRDVRFEGQKKYKGKEEKAERFELEDFRYDGQRDCYNCPEGKTLSRKSSREIQRGYNQYAAKKRECMICEKRMECIRMPNGKRKYITIPLKKQEKSLSKQMRDKIDTEEGRQRYERRLAIVEPVFANIRARKRMDRFTLSSRNP
jgi:transposase